MNQETSYWQFYIMDLALEMKDDYLKNNQSLTEKKIENYFNLKVKELSGQFDFEGNEALEYLYASGCRDEKHSRLIRKIAKETFIKQLKDCFKDFFNRSNDIDKN